MKNDVTLKIAASGLLLGMTVVSCKPSTMQRPMSISSRVPEAKQASAVYAKVEAAAARRDFVAALPLAEQAVELSPQDVAYRMVLADLYVKNGRFASAEATYGDVLTLNPENGRAALSKALAEVAQGKKSAALATLDHAAATAPASDLGLAYALAGEPQRALSILEPAARTDGANARVRQNLALAYAIAGDWQKARVTAAQDISPADLSARMQQWATFTQPATSYDQVASLLGVHPAADPGRPVQLALATAAPAPVAVAPVAVAAAEPVSVPAVVQPAPAVAEATPQPVASAEVPVKYAAAAETLVKAEPAVIKAPVTPYKMPVPAFEPVRPKPRLAVAVVPAPASVNPGKFVVQLGAFSKEASIDRAWQQAQQRYGLGGDDRALTTTVDMPGKGMLHRLSVAGFNNHADAARLCASIQAKGGACFVRATAGDAPVQWASLRSRIGHA